MNLSTINTDQANPVDFSTASAVVMQPLTLDEHGRMSYRFEHRVPQEIDGQITVHPKVVDLEYTLLI